MGVLLLYDGYYTCFDCVCVCVCVCVENNYEILLIYQYSQIFIFPLQVLLTGIFGYIGAKDDSTPNRCLVSLKLHTPLCL